MAWKEYQVAFETQLTPGVNKKPFVCPFQDIYSFLDKYSPLFDPIGDSTANLLFVMFVHQSHNEVYKLYAMVTNMNYAIEKVFDL